MKKMFLLFALLFTIQVSAQFEYYDSLKFNVTSAGDSVAEFSVPGMMYYLFADKDTSVAASGTLTDSITLDIYDYTLQVWIDIGGIKLGRTSTGLKEGYFIPGSGDADLWLLYIPYATKLRVSMVNTGGGIVAGRTNWFHLTAVGNYKW